MMMTLTVIIIMIPKGLFDGAHVEVADGGPGDAVLPSGEGGVHHPLGLQVGRALDLVVVEGELPRQTAVQPRLQEGCPLVLEHRGSTLIILTHPGNARVDSLAAVHHLYIHSSVISHQACSSHLCGSLTEDKVHEVTRLKLGHKVRLGKPLGVVLDCPQGVEIHVVALHPVDGVV